VPLSATQREGGGQKTAIRRHRPVSDPATRRPQDSILPLAVRSVRQDFTAVPVRHASAVDCITMRPAPSGTVGENPATRARQASWQHRAPPYEPEVGVDSQDITRQAKAEAPDQTPGRPAGGAADDQTGGECVQFCSEMP